jgi:prophage regulatory protein
MSKNLNRLVLRPIDVCAMVGVSRSTLYRLIARGEFPMPLQLTSRCRGWREAEVVAWLSSRANKPPTQEATS